MCSIFVASWTGVVKYHGPRPTPGANKVYVANHTSMIDFIILQQVRRHTVGQTARPRRPKSKRGGCCLLSKRNDGWGFASLIRGRHPCIGAGFGVCDRERKRCQTTGDFSINNISTPGFISSQKDGDTAQRVECPNPQGTAQRTDGMQQRRNQGPTHLRDYSWRLFCLAWWHMVVWSLPAANCALDGHCSLRWVPKPLHRCAVIRSSCSSTRGGWDGCRAPCCRASGIPPPSQTPFPGGSLFLFLACLLSLSHGVAHTWRSLGVAFCRCIQFDRKSIKDRSLVAQRLRQHVADATANPLLIFPEGT